MEERNMGRATPPSGPSSLAERLREDRVYDVPSLRHEAADRISELEKIVSWRTAERDQWRFLYEEESARLIARIEGLEGALREIANADMPGHGDINNLAHAALKARGDDS
jgi:hypothetical protein